MTPAARAAPFAVAALAAACGCARPARGGAAGDAERAPAAPVVGGAEIRRVQARDEVPLHGPRVDAAVGDWMLRGPGVVAVVSSSKGAIVDFGPDGGDDGLVAVDPALFVGLEQAPSVVESVAPAGPGGRALLVRKRLLTDPPLRLWTYVTLADGALRIESVATAGDRPALAVTVGEVVAWGNVPTWIEGHGFARSKGTWSGDFIAREGLGVAYALAPEHGHVVARFAEPEPGFHEWARTGERLEGVPAHGESGRRVVVLAQARGPLGQAVAALPGRSSDAGARAVLPAGAPDGAVAEVARCDGAPYARFDEAAAELSLPAGCWRVRLSALGHAPGAWLAPDAIAAAPRDSVLPRAGALRWRVRAARDAPAGVLPARILVRGTAGTPDPDWGEDPSGGASLNVIHADRDGERPIPPGRYHVSVTRGFEYTTDESDVEVEAGGVAVVAAELERVVDTGGWISADLHVHALPSPDAPTPLSDRVAALAAAGVEVAVATDHNAVTDYGPAIRERGLQRWVASIVGDEVTTRGVLMGHFNVFPLAPGAAPIAFDHVTAPALVSAARAAPPTDRAKI